ncbi:MAG: hypothetical protein KKD35_02540, partial [Elusimicrobia bacterium]|nr:hypothetical protein [Elusimicrobiota bacterium]
RMVMKTFKALKYLRLPIILIIGMWLISLIPFTSPRTERVDAVVMIDGELYFVLPKEYKVQWMTIRDSPTSIMWAQSPADYRDRSIYLKTRQIKYGQKIKGLITKEPLKKLQKNIDYYAEIGIAGRMWKALAWYRIVDNNKVIMTRGFDPKLPKNRTVTIEKNGKKIVVPYSIEFIRNKDGDIVKKVIVSHPEKGKVIEKR